ncbi:hypothetical protein NDU88_002977 [Pleurodeles waltl]|uniref:Myb/SANT-like DNA-binding domain-containing protein n=1 Tax=Pleurodeles waltl TaxID=8319 RepID=A0AAV7VEU6_PLEWA|nr:hypothetical protein NDU88_002977 [Pleurodeles waltl]
MARVTWERATAFTSEELETLVDGVLPQYGLLYGPPDLQVSAHQKKGIWCSIAKDVQILEVYGSRSTHCRKQWEDLRHWAWKTAETQLGRASLRRKGCPSNPDKPDGPHTGSGLSRAGWALEGITAATRGPNIMKGKEPAPASRKGKEPALAGKNGNEPAPAIQKGKEPAPAGKKGKATAPAIRKVKEPAPAGKKGKEPVSAIRKGKEPTPAGKKGKEPAPTAVTKPPPPTVVLQNSQGSGAVQEPPTTTTSTTTVQPSPPADTM